MIELSVKPHNGVKPHNNIEPVNNSTHEVPFALSVLANFSLAHTIFAAYKLGIWDRFESNHDYQLDLNTFIVDQDLEQRIVFGIVDHLITRNVLEPCGDKDHSGCQLGVLGNKLIRDGWLSYIVFYVGGYGNVLQEMEPLAQKYITYGQDIIRDTHYVALGTELMSKTNHHRSYQVVLNRARQLSPKQVLDIGCGSANFLIELVKYTEADHGLGVDLSQKACNLARKNVELAGIEEKIDILEADMLTLPDRKPELEGSFDLVTAMMVLHESLYEGHSNTVALLRKLARLLVPNTGRLILLDKHTDILLAGEAPPYFTEYKLVHDLTYQDLCTEEQWHSIIAQAGLELVHVQKLPKHTGSILLECRIPQ